MTAGAPPDQDQNPAPGRGAGLVAAGIGLSRLAGLVRELLMAVTLGVSAPADAVRAALRLPNLLQNLLGEGVLSASFIPVYSQLLDQNRTQDARRLASATAGALTVLAGLGSLVFALAAGPITSVLAWGFEGEKYELTVTLTRIMALGTGILVLSAWCLGVLNSHRRFFLSYVAPVLWNLAQIVTLVTAVLLGATEQGAAQALAWGMVVGGVLQLGIQLPSVWRLTGGARPRLDPTVAGWRSVARRFGPAVVGRGAVQIGAYLDLLLASLLTTGATAALGSAQVLYLLPISLFAMSVAASELPELSRLATRRHQLAERTAAAVARIVFWLAPCALIFVLCGQAVVGALFEWRNFGADDTRLVGLVLGAYGLGLVASGVSRLVQNALYALGDVSGPARIAWGRILFSAALGAVLMFQFDRVTVSDEGLSGWSELPAGLSPVESALRGAGVDELRLGALGLALASAAAAWVELALLRRRLLTQLGSSQLTRLDRGAHARALLVAGLVCVAVSLLSGPLPALAVVLIGLPVAGLAYVSTLFRAGVEESLLVLRPLRRLIWSRLPGHTGRGR